MAKVIFIFKNIKNAIPCNANERMKDIFLKFAYSIQYNINKLNFIYNKEKVNDNLEFQQLANEEDKKNIMKISVYENNNNDNNFIKSKTIICPECKENAVINIKNYKIGISSCKNGHKINNILFKDYENTQLIDISKIICDICKIKNKSNTFNNKFYKCITCKKNICPICHLIHNQNHKIIDYEQINDICEKHNIYFTKYCNNFNINICPKCKKEHDNHKTIYFEDIIESNQTNVLKQNILELKDYIKNIINKLNSIINNFDSYLNSNIFNDNMNFQITQNINNFNDIIINDINLIMSNNNMNINFQNLMSFYNKLNEKALNVENNKTEDDNKNIININKNFNNNNNNRNNVNNKIKNNYITAEININFNEINNYIRIINSYEQYQRENQLITDIRLL